MADKNSIVTLNVGSQRIGLSRFTAGKGGGLILQEYAFSELLGDPAADATRIPQIALAVVELVEKLGVAKARARYAISGHSVFTRFVKLPALDEEKVDDIVRFEAQQNVPFPIDEVAWDYQLVSAGDADAEVEVALVAIKSDSLDEINEAVEGGPLVPRAVDVAPMALYNAFRYNYAEAEGCSLLIDVGARTTNLLYIEGNRVFTRSIPVGGAAATTAIAKEFEMSFSDAEQRKKQDGFVSLGGTYADHEDPGIAAMSKIIRNTMTRLHSEVVRTTSAFRQQGGSAPSLVYLCGGSASLPYLREFLTEKLNLEVEYFNALKNVAIGPKIDPDAISADAHNLGELVGLALRQTSACPMEIDLIPASVARRRDVERRKPYLLAAAACFLSLLLAVGVYLHRKIDLTETKLAALSSHERVLSGFDSKISVETRKEDAIRERSNPIETAVLGRTRAVEILDHLNSKLTNDKLWFTQFEMLSGGVPLNGAQALSGNDVPTGDDWEKARPQGIPDQNVISHVRLYGLFRGSADVLYSFQGNLKSDPKFFDLPENINTDARRVNEPDGDEYAGIVRYDLKLSDPIRIDLAVQKGGAKR